jgi:CRISPR-associated Csx2 family protein
MQNRYVLITSIGTGLRKENGYRKTTYRFPSGKEFKTSVFLEALLETRFRDFLQIFITGTYTSDWGTLLGAVKGNYEDFHLALLEEQEKNNKIPDSMLETLQNILTDEFSIPVTIRAHVPNIESVTIDNIFSSYMETMKLIPSDIPILLDITHGFRSMPLLLYQALQYSVTDGKRRKIELVYGEYIDTEKISFVRDLSRYWFYSEYTTALHLLRERLDGFLLAKLIENEWNEASRWLRRFSGIVQANFCMQLDECLRSLRNILEKKQQTEHSVPWWIETVENELRKMCKRLIMTSKSSSLAEYSVFLAEREMYTQAIISLQNAVECKIMEHLKREDKIGDYDFWINEGKNELNKILSIDYELRNKIKNLEYVRNQIAHGGSKNPETGGAPNAENLKNQYDSGKLAVNKLFELIDKSR